MPPILFLIQEEVADLTILYVIVCKEEHIARKLTNARYSKLKIGTTTGYRILSTQRNLINQKE